MVCSLKKFCKIVLWFSASNCRYLNISLIIFKFSISILGSIIFTLFFKFSKMSLLINSLIWRKKLSLFGKLWNNWINFFWTSVFPLSNKLLKKWIIIGKVLSSKILLPSHAIFKKISIEPLFKNNFWICSEKISFNSFNLSL